MSTVCDRILLDNGQSELDPSIFVYGPQARQMASHQKHTSAIHPKQFQQERRRSGCVMYPFSVLLISIELNGLLILQGILSQYFFQVIF